MIRFRSLTNDQVGYAWGYEANSSGRSSVSFDAHAFDTLGDGMTQHSPLYSLPDGSAIDFLYSMADHLLKNPQAVEEAHFGWPHDKDPRLIAFFASLKWKENRRQWYSTTDLKVSTTDSKRHDRRWEEVPEYADGTPSAVFRLASKDYRTDLFHLFHLLRQIKEWFDERGGYSSSIPAKDHFAWLDRLAPETDTWQTFKVFEAAFLAVDRTVQAWNLTRFVPRLIDQYLKEAGKEEKS